ncbi:MAG: non-canonical purine NTP pyrophosphatase, RdgB/HAM1 family [Planctomycetes bacterium TMED75]|nr:non-canonical purine NTP pyrophosphatase, RdgB/HAM1 family [Planctomycetaceae bacterium]OUU96427.1 MAG: non-canonical purine NTP pyrophosphatase, RdgB/HAM1 family [Planctomycetes bacterium TMED75]
MDSILLATSNPHKLVEVTEILSPLGLVVLGLGDVGVTIAEPVEDAPTFEGNARLKACYYAKATDQLCLADDSGLEVDALDGAPGVFSARYSGVTGSREERDQANNLKLVAQLHGVPESGRSARFVCAMCLASPDGAVLAESRGTFEGVIIDEPRGTNGFGYDPHLLIPEIGRTSAQLDPEDKNARSHRGHATRQIANLISDLDKA